MDKTNLPAFATLVWEYSLLVFIAGLGVLQVAAAYGGFRGLLIAPGEVRVRPFPSRRIFTISREAFGGIFAAVTITPSLVDFFFWNRRNETGIIEGAEQAGFFVLAMASAVAFTFLFSSLINHWRLRRNEARGTGLEALKDITWAQAVMRSLARMRRGLG
ncbi:MAG: hypothetical protein FWH51_00495 [Dehalococcoidia bacterium]|nr:hypothetical protein [Dehalococcoidia bacterium]